jgi:hypothetical protein
MTPDRRSKMPPSITRILAFRDFLEKKSHFLFGPGQTGKTFLIRHGLEDILSHDLLDSSVFAALSRTPVSLPSSRLRNSWKSCGAVSVGIHYFLSGWSFEEGQGKKGGIV